jgi:methionyl-tRNA formyltransferase
LVAGCGEDTSLELKEVQLAGKKRMSAEAFLNGYKPAAGETFGALS